MRIAHLVLLGAGLLVIVALFVVATRPPDEAEVGYRPLGPVIAGPPAQEGARPPSR